MRRLSTSLKQQRGGQLTVRKVQDFVRRGYDTELTHKSAKQTTSDATTDTAIK